MYVTDTDIRNLHSDCETFTSERLAKGIERSDYHERRYNETVNRRKETGDPTLFVNEFYRWSREHPPSVDERTYLSTPEVMELQWYRFCRDHLLQAIQDRFTSKD